MPIQSPFDERYCRLWRALNVAIEKTLREQLTGFSLFPCVEYHMRFKQVANETQPIVSYSKRLRGVFFLMMSEDLGISLDRALPVAYAAEIMHNASLIIDDVHDGDKTRCGQSALWCREGKTKAMLTTILLLETAHRSLIRQIHVEPFYGVASDLLSSTCMLMAEGQNKDLSASDFWSGGLKSYLEIIGGKTAIVTANIWRLSTFSCSSEDGRSQLLHKFGYALGLAHQLEDDIDDLVGCSPEFNLSIDESNVVYFLASELKIQSVQTANDLQGLLLSTSSTRDKLIQRLLKIRSQLRVQVQEATEALPLTDETVDVISKIVQTLLHRNDDAIIQSFS